MASVPVRRLSREAKRRRVHDRVRMSVSGTAERPRLCVYRSLDHIYAQVIDDRAGRTLVLLGFTGAMQWPAFAASPEFADAQPNPLDRWSERVIGQLGTIFGARPVYPFGGPPWWPFQQWAQRAEVLHPSPLGILMHPRFGLWHAYRGALLFAEEFALPQRVSWPSPCESCATKPCITIWPAMVPTVELEIPDAIRETRKTLAAPIPSKGVKV